MEQYLESKPRYEILDGLRGVAAMLVVGYHLLEMYFMVRPISHSTMPTWQWISFSCSLALSLAMPTTTDGTA